MTIKINNIITATEYVNKVKLATQEERAAELLTDFYDCVLANTHPADVHDLWEPRGMVVACSGESETVKQLMKQHLQDNGWDAQIMPVAFADAPGHVVVKRPKGV
jgi:hypothetical protein